MDGEPVNVHLTAKQKVDESAIITAIKNVVSITERILADNHPFVFSGLTQSI